MAAALPSPRRNHFDWKRELDGRNNRNVKDEEGMRKENKVSSMEEKDARSRNYQNRWHRPAHIRKRHRDEPYMQQSRRHSDMSKSEPFSNRSTSTKSRLSPSSQSHWRQQSNPDPREAPSNFQFHDNHSNQHISNRRQNSIDMCNKRNGHVASQHHPNHHHMRDGAYYDRNFHGGSAFRRDNHSGNGDMNYHGRRSWQHQDTYNHSHQRHQDNHHHRHHLTNNREVQGRETNNSWPQNRRDFDQKPRMDRRHNTDRYIEPQSVHVSSLPPRSNETPKKPLSKSTPQLPPRTCEPPSCRNESQDTTKDLSGSVENDRCSLHDDKRRQSLASKSSPKQHREKDTNQGHQLQPLEMATKRMGGGPFSTLNGNKSQLGPHTRGSPEKLCSSRDSRSSDAPRVQSKCESSENRSSKSCLSLPSREPLHSSCAQQHRAVTLPQREDSSSASNSSLGERLVRGSSREIESRQSPLHRRDHYAMDHQTHRDLPGAQRINTHHDYRESKANARNKICSPPPRFPSRESAEKPIGNASSQSLSGKPLTKFQPQHKEKSKHDAGGNNDHKRIHDKRTGQVSSTNATTEAQHVEPKAGDETKPKVSVAGKDARERLISESNSSTQVTSFGDRHESSRGATRPIKLQNTQASVQNVSEGPAISKNTMSISFGGKNDAPTLKTPPKKRWCKDSSQQAMKSLDDEKGQSNLNSHIRSKTNPMTSEVSLKPSSNALQSIIRAKSVVSVESKKSTTEDATCKNKASRPEEKKKRKKPEPGIISRWLKPKAKKAKVAKTAVSNTPSHTKSTFKDRAEQSKEKSKAAAGDRVKKGKFEIRKLNKTKETGPTGQSRPSSPTSNRLVTDSEGGSTVSTIKEIQTQVTAKKLDDGIPKAIVTKPKKIETNSSKKNKISLNLARLSSKTKIKTITKKKKDGIAKPAAVLTDYTFNKKTKVDMTEEDSDNFSVYSESEDSSSDDSSRSSSSSSDDSDTDDEEVMMWASKMFGVPFRSNIHSPGREETVPPPSSTDYSKPQIRENSSYDDSFHVDLSKASSNGSQSRLAMEKKKKKKKVLKKKKAKRKLVAQSDDFFAENTFASFKAKRGKKKKKKFLPLAPLSDVESDEGIDEETRKQKREEERQRKESAKPLTAAQIRAILGEDDFRAPAGDNWVRRSVRQPSKALLNSKPVRALIENLKSNDDSVVVLKMKKFVNDPNAPQAVIDVALDALEENTNCEALYIQNFNEGMRDKQVLHLLKILQQPSCKIWCLNIGENYNVDDDTWEKFTKGLRRTKVTHMYASEHTITTEMKDEIRATIRENRKKHDMHINPNNLDVIIQCTHCWWNPVNAKALRPYLKKSGYEHILNDREAQGLRGSTSEAPTA